MTPLVVSAPPCSYTPAAVSNLITLMLGTSPTVRVRPSQKVLSAVKICCFSLTWEVRPRQNKRKAANPLKPSALSETSCSSNHDENPINEDDVFVDDEVAKKKKKKEVHPSIFETSLSHGGC